MKTKFLLLVSIFCLISKSGFPQYFTQAGKIVSPERTMNAWFGYSVSISGDYAIVGVPQENTFLYLGYLVKFSGAAFIYKRVNEKKWVKIQKLLPSDRDTQTTDGFGMSVDICGDYAIVGAPYESRGVNGSYLKEEAGAVYIYKRESDANWIEVQKIIGNGNGVFEIYRSPGDHFGWSVSLSDNDLIVGAPHYDEFLSSGNIMEDAGRVFAFKKLNDGIWNESSSFSPRPVNESDEFGYSVKISSNYFIVGKPGDDEDSSEENYRENAGSAYLYARNNAESEWSHNYFKINASDREPGDKFGCSVSITCDHAIVGALEEDEDASGENYLIVAGSAYIYERNNYGNWIQTQKLVASDRTAVSYFGNSVDIHNNFCIIGARLINDYEGAAYIFNLDNTGSWKEIQKLTASEKSSYDNFGFSVGIYNKYAIVGAVYEDEDEYEENYLSSSGSVYIFEGCIPSSIDDPNNIILNGDFGSCSLDPWWLWVDNGAGAFADASIQNGVCLIHNIQTSDYPEFWHIQLIQPFNEDQRARLEPYAMYSLSFDASAESDNRYTHVFFGQNEDPWLTQVNENIWLNSEKQTFTFDFTLLEVYSTMRLSLEFGEWNSDVRIDNVRLVKTGYDRDGDRIEDANDNCPDIANPVQDDADGDNIGNACDNCPNTPNASQQDSNGNGIGDVCETNTTTQVLENQNENDFRIYPNPVSDVLYIEAKEGTSVRLYDQTGRLLKDKILEDDDLSIDVSNLPSGLYILAVSNGIHSSVQKVIVQ